MKEFTTVQYTSSFSEDFSQFIFEAEEKVISCDYFFDLLYVKEKQFTLKEAVNNTEKDHSPAFNQFLTFLGKKVPVGGWGLTQFAEDEEEEIMALHTKYSIREDELDIFFNVSTFLPPQTKGHLGTRSVALIFLESSALDLNIFSQWGTSNKKKKTSYLSSSFPYFSSLFQCFISSSSFFSAVLLLCFRF